MFLFVFSTPAATEGCVGNITMVTVLIIPRNCPYSKTKQSTLYMVHLKSNYLLGVEEEEMR